ncbi:zinc finger protein 572-like [Schistocerca piceifrons]|uniref:zinc finger protein 572-like n=1 Tax=Schistocerca piceifrons TaxID=274613 RepID=UPI001F5F35DC|nr:zinc finger protein 572-like [Schistocerca piceifrons]
MQSFTESLRCLECSDCKASFSSASLLLQHFAQHVLERKPDGEAPSENVGELHCFHRYKGKEKESILETALKHTSGQVADTQPSSLESCSPLSSTASPICEITSTRISPNSSFCETTPAVDKKEAALARLDLQTRLENCIMRLAASRSALCESALDLSSTNSGRTCAGENIVVMKECTENVRKCSSSRKQKNPKKICSTLIKEQDQMENVAVTEEKSAGKRRYPCRLCPKAFGWSTDLKRHILTHTGERPFKCRSCDATFTRNFLLQKHESRVHVEGPNLNTGDSSDENFTAMEKKRKRSNGELSSRCNGVSCFV